MRSVRLYLQLKFFDRLFQKFAIFLRGVQDGRHKPLPHLYRVRSWPYLENAGESFHNLKEFHYGEEISIGTTAALDGSN